VTARGAIQGLALLAVLVLAPGCGRAIDEDELVTIERADLVIGVEVSGELAAVDSTDVMPPGLPDVWNYKIASLADEGAELKAGDPVVSFDASELQQELENMRNELDAAAKKLEKRKADAALARRDEALRLEEAEAALRKATVKAEAPAEQTAAIELEIGRIDRRIADMALERARNRSAQVQRSDMAELASLSEHHAYVARRVALIEQHVQRMEITAPRAGTVVYPTSWRGEKRKVGDAVWRMQAVLQIVGLDRMIGKGVVDEVDVARVAAGQPVSLRLDALPDVQLHGKVTAIARGVRARSQTDPSKVVGVELELTDQGKHPLRPGMRFRGEVEIARVPAAVVIPADAVFVTPDGPVAYRHDADELTRVALTLGRRSADRIEVVKGLVPGDRVSRFDPSGRAR